MSGYTSVGVFSRSLSTSKLSVLSSVRSQRNFGTPAEAPAERSVLGPFLMQALPKVFFFQQLHSSYQFYRNVSSGLCNFQRIWMFKVYLCEECPAAAGSCIMF